MPQNDIPTWEETSEVPAAPPTWEDTLSEDQAQALNVATTAPLEMTSRVNRAWGVGEASMQPPEPVAEPPRRRAIVTRAGVREVPPGEPMPGEQTISQELERAAQAIPPGNNAFTRPLSSLAKAGLGFGAAATSGENVLLAPLLASPAAPAVETYFAYQMGKGAVKSINDIIELMDQTGPVDEAWKQKMSDAIVNAEAAGVGTVAAGVGAKRGGAELIRQARAKLAASGARAVPPGLPPRGTVRTRTGTTTFDYDPAAAPTPVPPRASAPAPKPAAVPLATPEAEAAEQARLAAELGQEEEAPAPAQPAAAKVAPADLEPALLVNDKPVTGGASHEEIMRNAITTAEDPMPVMKAFADDKTHVFVDKSGKVYTRREAADALGEEKNLHSERLSELKKKVTPALPETAAGERALAQQIDKAAEAQTPPTPTYTGADATLILGKPLAEWFKATKTADLPKGEERAALANAIGAKNQPAQILKRLKDQERVRAFVRDSKKPPLKPEEALPAIVEPEEKAPASTAPAPSQIPSELPSESKETTPESATSAMGSEPSVVGPSPAAPIEVVSPAKPLTEITQTPYPEKFNSVKELIDFRNKRRQEEVALYQEQIGLTKEQAETLQQLLADGRSTSKFEKKLSPEVRQRLNKFFEESPLNQKDSPFEFWDFDKHYNPEELLSEDDPKYLSSALFSAIADRVPESPTSDKFIYAAVAASKLREMGLDQRDLARLLDEHAKRAGGNEEYFKLIASRLKTFLDRQGIQFPETKRPALPEAATAETKPAPVETPEAAAVPVEKAKEPQTSVDVPDLANQAVTLGRRVDLDPGEKREIGRAIEAARMGNPADLIAWVEKLKGLAAPKERVVKGVKFGGTGERAQDLITWLEGNFPGGIRITSKGDFGRYVKEATGAARKLLFMDKGEYVDNVMKAAELDGLGPWRSQDEFLEDVLRSASGRTTTGERLSAEEKILEDEAAQVEAFQQTALRNRGRTAEERKAAGKGIPVNSLSVGDTFTIKGQQVVVAQVDPYGDVLLDGGKRFGAQRLSDGQTIYPDNGQVTKAPEEGFGPGAASVAEFRSRENRRRILADMTAYLFGDRAGEVADALLRKLAREAVPKTMALSGESGNKMARFASATTAGPHMARAQAREVLGDHFQDRAFRRRLGAVLVEDRLRAIRRGFLQAARDATDPAEQARLQAQANDVNTLVGPGRVFDSEAAFRAALRDPEIAAAIERHKQGPQYEAELYHTAADGVLAGPGVNTGAFINLAPIYESEPSAIFTSSRKGDYTRPFKRRSVFSRRAAGTADVYELDYEPLVERMLRGNYEEYTKRELYDQLVQDRLAAVLPPGDPRPTFDGRPGEKFQIKRQTVVATRDGQTRIIPQYENLWVHPSVAHELRQAEHIGSPISNVALARTAAVINRIQLALGTDAVWHIGNEFAKIAGSQGGRNYLIDLARKVPLVNVVDAITRLTIASRRILQNDPEVLNQLAELAQIGNVRADIPERGRVSRMINLLDKAGRVVLDEFYRNLANRKNFLGQPLITPSEALRREWVSGLGQYNPRLMGQLESFFKEAGLSPFIVAARNFNRAALRKMVLSPGIRAANVTSALQMRAVEAFGVLATLIAVPTVLNTISVGKPFGRPGVPIGAIDTGKDDANGKHIYIDPAQWIGLRRGMRITGVNALLEGMIRGQPARQIKKQAAHDIIGAIAHPWAGPIVQMGSVLGTGYTTSFFKESKDPGDYWENFKAALKQINPVVHGYFQRQGKGVVGGLQSSLTTFAGAAGVKSRAPLSAVNQIHDLANGWASRSSDAKIRSEYEQHAKEDFSSDYQELRSALIRKDLQGARDAYRELREKGKKPSVIAETLRRPHPFTGSARSETMFKASLNDKERALYKQAEDERRQLYQAFRQMLNSQ